MKRGLAPRRPKAGLFAVPTLAQDFQNAVSSKGLWAAMQWLNAKVPYRYTAVFAFHGDTLRNLCLVDKLDARITRCEDQPITNSYCIYIRRSSEKFSVEEAALDPRVQGHPKSRSYQCYYGVPLFGADGKLVGTVCHFDVDPVPVTAGVVAALDDLAPFIARAVSHPGPGAA